MVKYYLDATSNYFKICCVLSLKNSHFLNCDCTIRSDRTQFSTDRNVMNEDIISRGERCCVLPRQSTQKRADTSTTVLTHGRNCFNFLMRRSGARVSEPIAQRELRRELCTKLHRRRPLSDGAWRLQCLHYTARAARGLSTARRRPWRHAFLLPPPSHIPSASQRRSCQRGRRTA